MKKLIAAAGAALLLLAGVALAQYAPGTNKIASLVGSFQIPTLTTGPQSAVIPVNGGVFTCAASAATVANTNVNAGSVIIITLKTVGGTVAQPFIATITPATGFTVTCGGSDTSVYNFAIIA